MSKFGSSLRQAPDSKPAKPRRRRLTQQSLQGLISAVAREQAYLPDDSPRRRPSLPQLKFMREAAE
jgi:hypothetical protein